MSPRKTPTDLEVRGYSHPAEDVWHLHYSYTSNPVPMNGSRGHWRASTARERAVRDQTYQLARAARIPALGRCRVQLVWWVETAHVRDPDNLARFEKRAFDALVLAGVVADDRPELMVKPRAEIIRIRDAEAPLVNNPGFTLTVTRLDAEETR